MEPFVTFKTDKFPPYEGESDDTNPRIHGKRLAEYLGAKLAAKGIVTISIYPEDWGWELRLENELFEIHVGCANTSDGRMGCLITPGRPYLSRWLRRIDTGPDLSRIRNAIDEILRNDKDIHEVEWEE